MAISNNELHMSPKIFVQIASYKDPECQHTVKDLYDKAEHPENIFVGICWQYSKKEDQNCFKVPYPFPNQVRVLEFTPEEAQGACWARNKVQSLWNGEEFTLQIDSHMRFEKHWDSKLHTMYQRLKDSGVAKPVITCYAPDYDLLGGFIPYVSKLHGKFDGHNILIIEALSMISLEDAAPFPYLGAFVSGHFLFSSAEIIKNTPYDPHLYFMGEEVSLSARLWTQGYDIYHPNEIIAYHLYWHETDKATHHNPETVKRKEDDKKSTKWIDKDLNSRARVRHIFQTEISDNPEIIKDLDSYGLGNVRTLHEYEHFCGVDFKKKSISIFSQNAIYDYRFISEKDTSQTIQYDMQSSPGSYMEFAALLVERLSQILPMLQVKSILDIGCGELLFMKHVALDAIRYMGVDSVEQLTRNNRIAFAHDKNKIFMTLDGVYEPLPKADMLFSRDMITHFSLERIWDFLENMNSSPYEFVCLTHYVNAVNSESQFGLSRPVNLCAEPFCFPEPLMIIPEKELNKHMAIWRYTDIEPYLYSLKPEWVELRLQVIPLMKEHLDALNTLFDNTENMNEFLHTMMQNCDESNAFIEREDIRSLTEENDRAGLIHRDIIYRLRYMIELECFDNLKPNFLNRENFPYASMIARSYLSTYASQYKRAH